MYYCQQKTALTSTQHPGYYILSSVDIVEIRGHTDHEARISSSLLQKPEPQFSVGEHALT